MHTQHAVDSIAHSQAAFARFDVHVTRLLLQRFEQQLVDQPNHRRLLSHLGQFAIGPRSLGQVVVVVIGLLLDEFVDRVAADTELHLDQLHDVVVTRQHRFES